MTEASAADAPVREVSRQVRAGGLRLRWVTWGEDGDPPVVLLHGAGAHAHWWAPLVPHLLPGWRLVAPDLRGHGESAWAPPPYLIEHFSADLHVLLDVLGLGTVVLIGHSMGGRVAAWFAAHHAQRVRGLALLDTRMARLKVEGVDRWRGIKIGAGPRRIYATRAQALAAFRVIPPEPGIAPGLLAELAAHAVVELRPGEWALRFDRRVLALNGSRLDDLFRLLPRIRCPAVVLRAAESTVTTPAECAATSAALGGCPVHVFPGGHHFLLVQPRAVAAALEAFLARAAESGGSTPVRKDPRTQ
jgi:pimeloyl-ACP methyl ester carboxylesterase